MKTVQVYTSDTCIQCKKVKKYFKENNINFEELNISSNQNYKKELIKKGYLSVPVVVIDNQDVLGFDLSRINQLLGI